METHGERIILMSPIPFSTLQLKQIHFPLVQVRANQPGSKDAEAAMDQNVVFRPLLGVENHWDLQLFLRQKSANPQNPILYEIEIHVIGIVEVLPQVPGNEREKLASVNGLSILYSAAREMIMSVTSRSIYGALMMPTLNFVEVLKQVNQAPINEAEKQVELKV